MATPNMPDRSGTILPELSPTKEQNSTLATAANMNGPEPGKFPPAAGARPFNPVNCNIDDGHAPFHILELKPDRAADGFFEILFGNASGVHVRGMVDRNYCNDLSKHFEISKFRKPRKDGVPGDEFGPTQYGKTPTELATIAYEHEGNLRNLIGGPENPISTYFRQIAERAEKIGLKVRPAVFLGQPMITLRAVRWTKNSGKPKWLLKLHEDWAQIVCSKNNGFEIQHVLRLVAFNFYIISKEGSGQLVVFDWKPTDADRKRIGVVDSGYPYDDTDVPVGTKEHVFEQNSGDLIVLDGAYLHGVLVGDDNLPGRLIVNGFAALLTDGTIALFA